MAVSVPSGIYNLGAVQLDSNRLANLEGSLLAKRAAREQALSDALDKYQQDRANRVTSTGMSTNDLNAFNKMKGDIQMYYAKNKDSFTKDPIKKYQYDTMWRNLENLVVESKNKGEEVKPGEEILYNPNTREKVNHEELMKDIDAAKAPIYIQDSQGNLVRNEARKPFKFREEIYLPKEIDFGKIFDESAKGFKGDTVLSVIPGSEKLPENKRNFKYDVIKGHGPDAVTGIIDNAFNVISQDRGAMSSLQKQVEKTSAKELAELWEKYTQKYHKEIAPDDPRSLLIGRLAQQAERRQYKDKETDEKAKTAYGASFNLANQGAAGQIDLTTYPDVDEKKDVSNIFRGVKVTGLPKGESMAAKRILYSPSSNEVTVTEWVGRDSQGNPTGEQTTTLPYHAFLQNIKTLNPATDFKYIETLPKAKTGKKSSSPKPKPY